MLLRTAEATKHFLTHIPVNFSLFCFRKFTMMRKQQKICLLTQTEQLDSAKNSFTNMAAIIDVVVLKFKNKLRTNQAQNCQKN